MFDVDHLQFNIENFFVVFASIETDVFCTAQDVSYKIQTPLDLQTTEAQQELLQFWEKQLKEVQEIDAVLCFVFLDEKG